MKPLSLVSTPPPQTAYERARAEARKHAKQTALETLAFAAEAAERLKELPGFGADLPPCVTHDSPITADRLSADIARMLASLRGEGRIR